MWAGTTTYMQGGAAPALPMPPGVQMSGQGGAALPSGTFSAISALSAIKGTCLDPHPNAVIRLERIRDNPSSVNVQPGNLKTTSPTNLPVQSTVAEVCGVDPTVAPPLAKLATLRSSPTAAATGLPWVPQPYDFWPNALYDTREGYNREPAPAAPFNTRITLGGNMNYIELDAKNLARWFNGAIGASGPSTEDPNVAPNNFVVYVSDRRGRFPYRTPLGVGRRSHPLARDREYGGHSLCK